MPSQIEGTLTYLYLLIFTHYIDARCLSVRDH